MDRRTDDENFRNRVVDRRAVERIQELEARLERLHLWIEDVILPTPHAWLRQEAQEIIEETRDD